MGETKIPSDAPLETVRFEARPWVPYGFAVTSDDRTYYVRELADWPSMLHYTVIRLPRMAV